MAISKHPEVGIADFKTDRKPTIGRTLGTHWNMSSPIKILSNGFLFAIQLFLQTNMLTRARWLTCREFQSLPANFLEPAPHVERCNRSQLFWRDPDRIALAFF